MRWPGTGGGSRALPDERENRLDGLLEEFLVDPVIDFLAHLLGVQNACVAHELEVVRDRRAGERGDLDDLPDVEALALLEREEDALAMLVAHRGEGPRDVA